MVNLNSTLGFNGDVSIQEEAEQYWHAMHTMMRFSEHIRAEVIDLETTNFTGC